MSKQILLKHNLKLGLFFGGCLFSFCSSIFADEKADASTYMISTNEKKEYVEDAKTIEAIKAKVKEDDLAACAEQAERYFQIEIERVKETSVKEKASEKQEASVSDKLDEYRQACLYFCGKGENKKDLQKANELFSACKNSVEALADRGDIHAQKAMSTICKQLNKEKEAAGWLDKLASKGDPEAQYRMGLMYYSGVCGVSKDQKKSFEYFKKAADNGSRLAAIRLAYMLREGIGTEKNISESKSYTKKARKRLEK
jgi:TPR repeat protein